jgi:hypothetical protein
MADATAAVFMSVLMEAWVQAGTRSTLRVADLRSRDPRPMLDRGEIDGALGFFPDVARELAASDQRGTARLDARTTATTWRHEHAASHVMLRAALVGAAARVETALMGVPAQDAGR